MNENNSDKLSLSQALELIKNQNKENFSNAKVNLAELERLTGITRAKLRRLKKNNFQEVPHGLKGQKSQITVLSGFTSVLNNLLKNNVTNSEECFRRLLKLGYTGGVTTVKNYIALHKDLIPSPRHILSPQGNRGRRYSTEPGHCYQMDWGFVKVRDYSGLEYQTACFAMICHHCGQRYIEFFPNAKQESLFIGMIHAFIYMGIPHYVLTDNMKSVVIKRDFDGRPIWNHDYEVFMKTIGFETRLCKPYHPFTKGKVERLIQFVKRSFLLGRSFTNVTELNREALEWCHYQNTKYHKSIDMIPQNEHEKRCSTEVKIVQKNHELMEYLCPLRKISFDGFVNYEGRRFGIPYSYTEKTVRISRNQNELKIYSSDLSKEIVIHDVTWSKKDSYCKDQYAYIEMPEEFPTSTVKTIINQLEEPKTFDKFARFDFSLEDKND